MEHRISHSPARTALVGAILALGAPGGWLLFEWIVKQVPPVESLQASADLYLYLLLSTTFVFALFGHAQGKMLERMSVLSENLLHVNRELERASRSDTLTNLFNAKAFHELLSKWVALHGRTRNPVSLVVIAVQDIRNLNETHGRSVADEYLRHIAHLLMRQRRQEDIVARIGGQEFAIVLPNTTLDDAETVANRIVGFLQSTPFIQGGHRVACQAAFGVTQLSESDDARSVLTRAEVALYQAKRSGRGKIVAVAATGREASHR